MTRIEDACTKAELKTAHRWSERFGRAPLDEIKTILHEIGCYTEEINPLVAQRAMTIWIKTNQRRMRRDLKKPIVPSELWNGKEIEIVSEAVGPWVEAPEPMPMERAPLRPMRLHVLSVDLEKGIVNIGHEAHE